MNNAIRFRGVVPKKARGKKNPMVAKCRRIIETTATQNGGSLVVFEISKGVVTAEIDGEKAQAAVESLFKGKPGVEVSTLSAADSLLEDVKIAEEADAKKEAKKEKVG